MIFHINLLRGVNQIEFGMKAKEVRALLPGDFESSDSFPFIEDLKGKYLMDDFDEIGVYCCYNGDWILEAVGFYQHAQLILGEVDVFRLTARQCKDFLEKIDPDWINYHGEYISKKYSFSFQETDEDDFGVTQIRNFLIGYPGYFEYAKKNSE